MPHESRGARVRLSLAGGIAYCSYAICRAPVLPLFARELGAGPALVGFVVGASTITGVFLKLPAGALSDVFGRRALLITGALVFALLPFAYVPVATLAWLVALRFVHGSATAIFGPVASATLSDLAPADRRGRWLGTYAAVQGAGQAIGPVAAGYLIARGDFDRAFLASGALGLVAFLLIAGWRHEPVVRSGRSPWRHGVDGVREVMRNTRILTTSMAQAGQFFVNGAVNAFVPLYARETLGLSAPQVGLVFGLQTVSTLLARPVFGVISDRLGRRPVIAAGLMTCAAAIACVSLASRFETLAGATMLYGAGLAVTTSATSAYVTDLARQARYGAAHGVFGTIYDVGDAAGPIVAGLLVAWTGYRDTFRLITIATVVLAIAFMTVSRGWPSGSTAEEGATVNGRPSK